MSKKKIAFLSLSLALLMSVLGGALFGQSTQRNSMYRYLSIFTEVFDLARSNYVEPVASDQLLEGAFSGVTDAIDEFSYYVPPTQMNAYRGYVDFDDNGTGIIVTKRFGYAFVISAVPGSPAAKAGVERGDFIEKINGKLTTNMAVWQIKNALSAKGPLDLTILRGGQARHDQVKIEAASYHPLPVTKRQFGDVAVVAIPYFEKGTAAEFRSTLEQVRKSGTRKLIVDVRGNAGGSIDEAVAAADELLTSGLITSVEGRTITPKKQWQADRATAFDGDVQVLTDSSTAGGAEIFAAAVKGAGRGKMVGQTTYGKSVVQRFITLPSGGGVFMTVGYYTTPDLKAIKESGVRPDVVVDLTALAIQDVDSNKPAVKDDLILQKALSLFGQAVPAETLKKAA